MARYRKIFAALDGGDTQEAVVRRALSMAHDNNAEVLFGHVVDSTKYETGGVADNIIVDRVRSGIEEALAPFLARAKNDECIPSVEISVKIGRIVDTLEKEIIKPFDPELVICGVRGLSNIKYAFVGSVSTYLIRNAPCDVLVVRPETLEEHPQDEWHD